MRNGNGSANAHKDLGIGVRRVLALGALIGLLSGCAGSGGVEEAPGNTADTAGSCGVVSGADASDKPDKRKSYVVRGKRYYTKPCSDGHVEQGVASWYGRKFHGRKTSSGERYNMYAMTAAHKSLPLPTYAQVTNLENGRSTVVKVNDRGPFHGDRVIDLSYSAARTLGVVGQGTALVEVRAIDSPSPEALRPGADLLAKADRRAGKSRARGAALAAQTRPPAAKAPDTSSGQAALVAQSGEPAGSQGAIRADEAQFGTALADTVSPAERPRVAAAASESASGLYLQVGAFGSRTNAEQLRQQLVDRLAEQVQVRGNDGNRARRYEVQVGPLANRQKAHKVSRQLASLGLTEARVVAQ